MEAYYANGTVHAIDEAKTSMELNAPSWEPVETAPTLTAQTDAELCGRVRRLAFPPAFVFVTDLATGERTALEDEQGPVSFPKGRYELRIETPLKLYIRLDGAFELSLPDYEQGVLSLRSPKPVRVGFRSRDESPPDAVVVPETPEGVATALSALPVSHRSTTADRSFNSMRTHPPLVEFGEETSVPEEVKTGKPDTGVELTLPPDLKLLLPAASLVHYLGADLRTEPGTEPTFSAGGETLSLGHGREYEQRVAALLRRCFWLDCLVRTAGPHNADVQEADLLDELALDAETLYDAPISERVAAYRDAAFERVADRLPEWHLSLYIEPTYENVQTLPHVLANVPQLFTPRSGSLSGADRLDSSLSDFYRAADNSVPTVELVEPELGPSRFHGWLSDGVALDTFKALPEAYENRAAFRARADEPISVVSVLNEGEMGDEHSQATDIYRRRAEQLDIDVDVRESLTTAELARTIESRTDLLHFIGHCEESGLRCPDGNLSVSSVDTSRAQTFFLNACGSYEEGLEMVRKGSIAGAVTFEKVLDSHAATVGTMFARLVVHGYSIERALSLARRRVIMGKDYAVVGDGSHVLTQTESLVGPEVTLSETETDRFSLVYRMPTPTRTGSRMKVHLEDSGRPNLIGNEQRFTLDRDELISFLQTGEFAVIYRKDVHWSTELADRLTS
ncbi:MAG: hypothetical protein ABEH90_08670 [Halolamina sp.]